jgi:hypothetical protein
MTDSTRKIIPKLEDEATFAGKIPHNGDGDIKRILSRYQGSWHWLLTSDGTPATVLSSCENRTVEDGNRPLLDKKTSDGGSLATKTSAEEIKRDLVQGSWYWLLAPDDSPVTVDTTVESGGTSTVDTAIEGGTSEDSFSPTTNRSNEHRRRDLVHGSWYWLLAPDDSPANVNHSAGSRAATTRKRKPRDPPDSNQLDSRSRRSCRRRRDINVIDTELIETEDGNSSGDTVDGDDSDDACQSCYIAKEDYAKWEEKFQLLVEYKNKHKTTKVPHLYPILGIWVSRQRMLYKAKRLTKYRRQCLESIGFVFDKKTSDGGSLATKTSAEEIKRDLVQGSWYWLLAPDDSPVTVDTTVESGGTSTVDTAIEGGTSEDSFSPTTNRSNEHRRRDLVHGSWYWLLAPDDSPANVNHSAGSRAATTRKRKPRDPPDSNQLDSRSRRSCRRRRDIWMEMYQRLSAYQKKFKCTRVSEAFDLKLYKWVEYQRRQCTNKDRVDLLNVIGFDWNRVTDHSNK